MTRSALLIVILACVGCGGGTGGSGGSGSVAQSSCSTTLQVFSASQPAGPWTGPQNVTIAGETAGSCPDPSPLLLANGQILLYYTVATSTSATPSIAVAQSSDGFSFTKRGLVYTAGSDGFANVSDAFPLILPNGTVRVFFSPFGPETYSITSLDSTGITFPASLDAGLRSASGGVPGALHIASSYYLYVNSNGATCCTTQYLTSPDGITFTAAGNLSLADSDAFSPLATSGGQYLSVYQCAGSGPTGAVTCLASSNDGIHWTQVSQVGPGSVPALVITSTGQLLVYSVHAT